MTFSDTNSQPLDKSNPYIHVGFNLYTAKFRTLSSLKGMAAGGLAGFCQIIITTPMELLKIQMQRKSSFQSSNNYSRFYRSKRKQNVCLATRMFLGQRERNCWLISWNKAHDGSRCNVLNDLFSIVCKA
jgi:hypothetical protein